MKPKGYIFPYIFLVLPFMMAAISGYKTIQAVTRKGLISTRKEYQQKEVPAGQFQEYKSVEITSEEACSILCLKDVSKCASFKVEDYDGKRGTCKLGSLIEDQPAGATGDVVFVELCKVIEIVSQPSLGATIAGLWSYLEHNNGKPWYKKDADPTLCLLHSNHWKVEKCGSTDPATIGFILSPLDGSKSNQALPQYVGQAWSYYDQFTPQIDSNIEVKCKF